VVDIQPANMLPNAINPMLLRSRLKTPLGAAVTAS